MQNYTVDEITLSAMIRLCGCLKILKHQPLMNGTNFKMKMKLRILKIRRSRLRFNYNLLKSNDLKSNDL
ncbi:hypothetical protein DDN72_17345 [Vibrio cholerae]|nr:hypothetical protein [Vibrio cholerae]